MNVDVYFYVILALLCVLNNNDKKVASTRSKNFYIFWLQKNGNETRILGISLLGKRLLKDAKYEVKT